MSTLFKGNICFSLIYLFALLHMHTCIMSYGWSWGLALYISFGSLGLIDSGC